jgi:hypothetical protein
MLVNECYGGSSSPTYVVPVIDYAFPATYYGSQAPDAETKREKRKETSGPLLDTYVVLSILSYSTIVGTEYRHLIPPQLAPN